MRRILMIGLGTWATIFLVAACGDESPTGVGADLLGPGVRTYEVIFEAEDFLVQDTTYNRIGTLNDADFRVIAHQFHGEMDARTLFSVDRPIMVVHSPAEGQTSTDTISAFVGGVLTVVVDTAATTAGPIEIEILQVMEDWRRLSATWDVRIDTAGVTHTWATPGGTVGETLATATWSSGDTLRINLDSAAVAVWGDTTAARIGGLIRTTTPGSRLFIEGLSFEYNVVPAGTDSVVPAGTLTQSKILATEDTIPPAPGVLRVGGLPAWRSALRFRPIPTMRIPCGPGMPSDCTVALEDVTVNLASLLLQPIPAGARRIERYMRVEGRGVFEGPGVPLVRSPLSPPIGPPTDSLAATLFDGTNPDPAAVPLPITSYVRFHLNPSGDDRAPEWVVLTAVAERMQFGFAAFGGLGSDRPPRLRLVVSVPDEVLMR
jgi:hypothetical protein